MRPSARYLDALAHLASGLVKMPHSDGVETIRLPCPLSRFSDLRPRPGAATPPIPARGDLFVHPLKFRIGTTPMAKHSQGRLRGELRGLACADRRPHYRKPLDSVVLLRCYNPLKPPILNIQNNEKSTR